MAGFRMHVGTAALCGGSYGVAAVNLLGFSPESGVLAAGVTTVGGMLPDLDSDTGRPIKEIFGVAAAVLPLLALPRLQAMHLTHEGMIVAFFAMYLAIRYGLSSVLQRISVHRGMFHSIPAMLIAGLFIYLEYGSPDRTLRGLLALGVMIGFLSHLILDEIYSVDFNGLQVRLKSSAGSAVKLFSPAFGATVICYSILGLLASIAWLDWKQGGEQVWRDYWAKLEKNPAFTARFSR
jgi:membrane-bound metal-dependent hydrolase YbcI (DUF457 family)